MQSSAFGGCSQTCWQVWLLPSRMPICAGWQLCCLCARLTAFDIQIPNKQTISKKKRGANKNKRQSELDKEDWTIERKTSSTHFPILLYHSISLHLICAYAGEQRHATPVPSSSCILHDTSASDWLWLLVSSKQWQAAAWLAATVQRNGMELKWGRRQAEKRI